MNKKLNNIFLLVFPTLILVAYGFYKSYIGEIVKTTYQYHWYYGVVDVLFLIVVGIFMYYFLNNYREFNIIAGVLGIVLVVLVFNPITFMYIIPMYFTNLIEVVDIAFLLVTFIIVVLIRKKVNSGKV